jgi:hypothetical protein
MPCREGQCSKRQAGGFPQVAIMLPSTGFVIDHAKPSIHRSLSDAAATDPLPVDTSIATAINVPVDTCVITAINLDTCVAIAINLPVHTCFTKLCYH